MRYIPKIKRHIPTHKHIRLKKSNVVINVTQKYCHKKQKNENGNYQLQNWISPPFRLCAPSPYKYNIIITLQTYITENDIIPQEFNYMYTYSV